jgi:hypothetical protein
MEGVTSLVKAVAFVDTLVPIVHFGKQFDEDIGRKVALLFAETNAAVSWEDEEMSCAGLPGDYRVSYTVGDHKFDRYYSAVIKSVTQVGDIRIEVSCNKKPAMSKIVMVYINSPDFTVLAEEKSTTVYSGPENKH